MDIEIQCKAKIILIIMKAVLIIADIIPADLEIISGLLCQLIATGVRLEDCERKRAKSRVVISCCVFNIC